MFQAHWNTGGRGVSGVVGIISYHRNVRTLNSVFGHMLRKSSEGPISNHASGVEHIHQSLLGPVEHLKQLVGTTLGKEVRLQ